MATVTSHRKSSAKPTRVAQIIRSAAGLFASMIVAGLISITHVGAQTELCPLKSGDACDHWYFERADQELVAVVAKAIAKIDQFAHADTRKDAKDQLQQAQRLWVQFREIECDAVSAFMWLRSARTREGFTAACLDQVTRQRIAELKKRYLLRD